MITEYLPVVKEDAMATKSFTTSLFFNKKSADNLIKALETRSNVKRSAPNKIKEINDINSIKKMFSKR